MRKVNWVIAALFVIGILGSSDTCAQSGKKGGTASSTQDLNQPTSQPTSQTKRQKLQKKWDGQADDWGSRQKEQIQNNPPRTRQGVIDQRQIRRQEQEIDNQVQRRKDQNKKDIDALGPGPYPNRAPRR